MRLRPRRRKLVWSSSVDPAGRYGAPRYRRLTRTRRTGRLIRIGALLTVIALRPRWRPVLAGVALIVAGAVQRGGPGGVVLVPGVLFLWYALLIRANPDADRKRRTQLERELAAFSTPAQRCDLEAILDRYPDGVTCEIREILARQARTPRYNGVPGAGRY